MNHVRDSNHMNAYGRMKEVMVEDDEPTEIAGFFMHLGEIYDGTPKKKKGAQTAGRSMRPWNF